MTHPCLQVTDVAGLSGSSGDVDGGQGKNVIFICMSTTHSLVTNALAPDLSLLKIVRTNLHCTHSFSNLLLQVTQDSITLRACAMTDRTQST